MVIRNSSDFSNIFKSKLTSAINIITERIYERLKQNIQIHTYDRAGEPTMYKRSWEFKNEAWAFNKAQTIANKIMASVTYEPYNMQGPGGDSKFRHGNFNAGVDRRAILADLLNVYGIDEGNDFGGKEREPYWDVTIYWIDTNWEKLIDDAFRKVGIINFKIN